MTLRQASKPWQPWLFNSVRPSSLSPCNTVCISFAVVKGFPILVHASCNGKNGHARTSISPIHTVRN